MDDRLGIRLLAIATLVAVLFGCFVLAGTVQPSPDDRNYPNEADIAADGERYVGDRVVVGGTVIETDPLTIEAEPIPGEPIAFVVEDTARTPEVGDTLTVYGTLRSENRIRAIEPIHREPWEMQYMYLVSFLGGLWVLGRLCNGWRFDRESMSLVPRTAPLISVGGR
ncbi:hypothetical protein [Natronomonas salsuginis]|uniref:Uncharacterized protein n=1 Tax=Natronomonas salsuginis TaxID=2217661 RepID=A0A4U5J8M2_9EURY|nr:hypothetical protein [Natronomonas salsuginis]TKR25450.1 hypothetical protein DM868_08470 [Natronomonas salsuginis]